MILATVRPARQQGYTAAIIALRGDEDLAIKNDLKPSLLNTRNANAVERLEKSKER